MPRDELVVAYSQSGRHALTPSSVRKKLNPSLSNMGEGFINWGYIVVGQVVLLDDAGGILGYLVGNQPTLPLPAILSNAIN